MPDCLENVSKQSNVVTMDTASKVKNECHDNLFINVLKSTKFSQKIENY